MKTFPKLAISVRLGTAVSVVLSSLLLVHAMVRVSDHDIRQDLAQYAAMDARHVAQDPNTHV